MRRSPPGPPRLLGPLSGRLGRADGWSELADAMALPHLLPTPLRLRKPGSIVGLETRFVGVLAACADAALRPGSQLQRQRRHLERRGGLSPCAISTAVDACSANPGGPAVCGDGLSDL